MKNYIALFATIVLCLACTKKDNRKVVDDFETIYEEKKTKKTTEIADLPILIDSTSIIIHPVGNYTIHEGRSGYSSGKWYRGSNQTVSNYSQDRFTGNISNLQFEHIDSTELKSLTDKTIRINSMLFLRDVFEMNNKGYFLYQVIDKDTNGDHTLNSNDLRSLYLSNLNGTNFRKLSPDLQDLAQWKIILEAHKLYFKTIEDTDGNGEFDQKDQMHYFYLDLNLEHSKVVEYFPV